MRNSRSSGLRVQTIGKILIAKKQFPEYKYISLENPDTRNFALEETNGLIQSGYEIKYGETFNSEYFKGLKKWGILSDTPIDRLAVYTEVQKFYQLLTGG